MCNIEKLIDELPIVKKAFYHMGGELFPNLYIIYDTPQFITWKENMKFELDSFIDVPFIFEYLKLLNSFDGDDDVQKFNELEAKSEILKRNIANFTKQKEIHQTDIKQSNENKIFIVHGHDENVELKVKNFVTSLGFKPIILHEEASKGMTIIEKLENYSNVSYGIVIYTKCDLGRKKDETVEEELPRARQNVVLEHGYLMGKLSRERVCALVEDGVETPGDCDGVVYVPMDKSGMWQYKIAQEMQAVHLPADLNRIK